MNSTSLNTTTRNEIIQGWVSQPNTRGTLDIVISCLTTIFLCIWTCVCVSVPAPHLGSWDILRDRWHMVCTGAIGPELVVLQAIGQNCSARASSKAFKDLNHKAWTQRHSFFADMGGIHVQFPGWRSFPVNAKQLHYLVSKGYLPYPEEITVDAINDKNKGDGLSRFIAALQICWFTLSTISRPIGHLAVTTLELTTLGYIVCALGILIFWRHKPMDIQCPIVLNCETKLERLLQDEGKSVDDFYQSTPLDFISRQEWTASRCWSYYVNILRKLRIVLLRPKVKPVQHFSSFNFAVPTQPMLLLMFSVTILYSGIFVAGWDFHFPTVAERVIWRTASLGTFILVVAGGAVEMLLTLLELRRSPQEKRLNQDMELARRSSPQARSPSLKRPVGRVQRILNELRNNSPDNDPALDMSIHYLLVTTPICALYSFFRLFILVEDLLSLRELPQSAYLTVDWSMYVPHF